MKLQVEVDCGAKCGVLGYTLQLLPLLRNHTACSLAFQTPVQPLSLPKCPRNQAQFNFTQGLGSNGVLLSCLFVFVFLPFGPFHCLISLQPCYFFFFAASLLFQYFVCDHILTLDALAHMRLPSQASKRLPSQFQPRITSPPRQPGYYCHLLLCSFFF